MLLMRSMRSMHPGSQKRLGYSEPFLCHNPDIPEKPNPMLESLLATCYTGRLQSYVIIAYANYS